MYGKIRSLIQIVVVDKDFDPRKALAGGRMAPADIELDEDLLDELDDEDIDYEQFRR